MPPRASRAVVSAAAVLGVVATSLAGCDRDENPPVGSIAIPKEIRESTPPPIGPSGKKGDIPRTAKERLGSESAQP